MGGAEDVSVEGVVMPRVQREGGVDYYGERIEMDELTGRDQREFG